MNVPPSFLPSVGPFFYEYSEHDILKTSEPIRHFGFKGAIMGSLKSARTTSYRSSIGTIALNCVVFEKIAFFAFWRQTDRQTDEQMDSTDLLSRSRCRERRLNNLSCVCTLESH